MIRRPLLLSAAIPALFCLLPATAYAQATIDADTSETVRTSDPDGSGTADDTTISSGVTVTIDTDGGTGAAVDSDNTLTNSGTITSEDNNDVTGVVLEGGNTGGFTNSGAISLTETYVRETDAENGFPDGPFAEGSGRTGILVSGASPFTGSIVRTTGTTAAIETLSGSSILVEGNESFGIRVADGATVINNIEHDGAIGVIGDNSAGIAIDGTLDGNLRVAGTTRATGENSNAIRVTGDIVDGGITIGTLVAASGYSFPGRQTFVVRELLNEDDQLQGGAALLVAGNVDQGINITTINNVFGQLQSDGSAPAILIMGETATPITIGAVPGTLAFGLINEGNITTNGGLDDIDSTAIRVADATVTGGFLNTGIIQTFTYENGISTGLMVDEGAVLERFNNAGLFIIRAAEAIDDDVDAATPLQVVAVDVATGGTLESIFNSSAITARLDGRNGQAIAIRDASGTLQLIDNVGTIQALGITTDEDAETTFDLVAIDASANTAGLTIVQRPTADENGDPILDDDGNFTNTPSITGDILLGSGDDVLDIRLGSITGDVAFGDGADIFSIAGGSTFSGDITDTDGQLIILVADSTFGLSGGQPLDITSASFDATSELRAAIDVENQTVSTLVASGEVVFEDGAIVTPTLSGVIGQGGDFTIVDAGTLTINGSLESLSNTVNSPFLYDTQLSLDPNDANNLLVTLDLRTPTELGLDTSQAGAFNAFFDAMTNNADLGGAFVGISQQDEFYQAYNQLMPEYSAAALQFILANVDGSTGAVGSHLDNLRRDDHRGGGAWIEEFTYYADRELAGLSDQYRGFGFGVTGGLDASIGPFDAVGINATFASTEIEDVLGIDDPLEVVSLQLGTYAGWSNGPFSVSAYGGAGYNSFESNRAIDIGTFSATPTAEWSGYHYNGSVRAAYDAEFGKWFVRPSVSVDYLSLQEEGYTENGGGIGINLTVDDRTANVASVTGMLNVGRRFENARTWWAPSARIGVRQETSDSVVTRALLEGSTNYFEIQSQQFPETGLLVGFTFAGGSKYSSLGLDYDADIRDGFIRHTGRIVVRLLF